MVPETYEIKKPADCLVKFFRCASVAERPSH